MADKSGIGLDITIKEKLGKGSYSSVHRCVDENGREMAVKCISTEFNGIPNILEPSIMATINHPNITRALSIMPLPNKLYIFMEKAVGDLREHSKRREGKLVELDTVRQRAYSLVQAVACLHNQRIIHADIKASNSLLFSDGTVQLSDFTVSVKQWTDETIFTHSVGTPTHRPLECYIEKGWSYPFDIWSLGCTLYELAYGENLIPLQTDKGITQEEENQRYINCLLDWNERNPAGRDSIDLKATADKFYPFKFPPEFSSSAYEPLNKLILAMLRVDPSKRITIPEILQSDFFNNFKVKKCLILTVQAPTINQRDKKKVEQILTRYTSNPVTSNVALQLYFRCSDLKLATNVKAAGCALIACKLTLSQMSAPGLDLHLLFEAERTISKSLTFCLHTYA